MKKAYSLIFISFIALVTNAQDLTGIWRGHFRSNNVYEKMGNIDDRYKIEVQIAQKDNKFEAVTYSYLTTVFYGKASADGTINPSTQKVLLRELKLLEVRMSTGDVYSMTYFLKYSKLGNDEFLEGTYVSYSVKDSSRGEKGTVFLHKVTTSDFSKEPFLEKRENEIKKEKNKISVEPVAPVAKPNAASKTNRSLKKPATTAKNNNSKAPTAVKNNSLKADSSLKKSTGAVKKNTSKPATIKPVPKPALVKADLHKPNEPVIHTDSITKIEKKNVPVLVVPKVLTNRQNELVKTITVNTNEIELDIYDDGAIDNDTVSVYVDKKNVVYHAMLTDRPIVVKFHMDEDNNYHEVVMVAENEGEIPPNTSLMVVKAGGKEYEVRIVSTEQKNATVIFKFEK